MNWRTFVVAGHARSQKMVWQGFHAAAMATLSETAGLTLRNSNAQSICDVHESRLRELESSRFQERLRLQELEYAVKLLSLEAGTAQRRMLGLDGQLHEAPPIPARSGCEQP